MKKIITGIFAVAAFTFSAVAQDQRTDQKKWDRDGQNHMHDGRGMRGMEQLNLTDAQKQQMKTINEDFRSRMQALGKNDNILVKDMKAQREALMQDRKNKISAILTPEQKTKFDQMHKEQEGRFGGGFDGNKEGNRDGNMGRERGGDRMGNLKSELGLTDEQLAKIKSGSETFRQRAKAIQENQSLSQDQKKAQMDALQKDREASFKSFLTAEQIIKLNAMKNKGDWKEKEKGEGWKEKRKSEDGKEKIKVKTT